MISSAVKLYLILFCLVMSSCGLAGDTPAREKIFQMHIGTYVLDTDKTDMGGYRGEIEKYSKLTITFRADSTFQLNMSVPFLEDSSGNWFAGDGSPYDFNQLFFRCRNYEGQLGEQFYPPFSDDSIFLLNSCTPKQGAQPIHEIYFKKIGN